jgi:hypothetical protein
MNNAKHEITTDHGHLKCYLPAKCLWSGRKRLWWVVSVFLMALILAPTCGQRLVADGVIKDTLQRSKKEPVVEVTLRRPALKPKERRRLSKKLRNLQEDIQILIGDNVDTHFTPKEMAFRLIERWKNNGSMSVRGILILLAMEQNRVEIVLGQGLTHILDEDWCNEIAHTKMVPWFRKDQYAKGLEDAINEIETTLRAVKNPKEWKNRFKWAAGLWSMFGGWRYRRQLRRMLAGRNLHDDDDAPSSPPPSPEGLSRMRARHRRRLQSPDWIQPSKPTSKKNKKDYSQHESSLPWDNVLRFIGIASPRSTWHMGSYKGNPGQTMVNVFYPPTLDHHQSPTQHLTPEKSSPHPHQEHQQKYTTTAPSNNEKTPFRTTTFLSNPEPFRPLSRLRNKTEDNTSTQQTPVIPLKPSSDAVGGGASWSTVSDRSIKEALIPIRILTSNQKIPNENEIGGGATWSRVSARTTKNSQLAKTKTEKSITHNESLGGGANWSNVDDRAKPNASDASKSFGGGASW